MRRHMLVCLNACLFPRLAVQMLQAPNIESCGVCSTRLQSAMVRWIPTIGWKSKVHKVLVCFIL